MMFGKSRKGEKAAEGLGMKQQGSCLTHGVELQ